MDKEKILEKLQKSIQGTMSSAIGIKITDVGNNFICGKMPVDKRTVQPFGILHGGASVALAESLGSIAGSMKIDLNTEMVVGIEINVNHLKSVRDGWVEGKASPIRVGKKIQVWEIKITNEKSELVCISRLTLAVVEKR